MTWIVRTHTTDTWRHPMAAVLSRTRSVLDLDETSDVTRRRYRSIDEENGHIRRSLYIDVDTFTDLGCPEQITITVEPGDTLN